MPSCLSVFGGKAECFVVMNDLPHDVRFSRFLFWNGYFSITICDAHDVEIVLLGSVIIWKADRIDVPKVSFGCGDVSYPTRAEGRSFGGPRISALRKSEYEFSQ
jgi:hypothetical protein